MHTVSCEFIDGIFSEAIAATVADRRLRRRHPFFRAATIVDDRDAARELPAFCRDISRGGVGLLHSQPIDVGRTLTVKLPIMGRQFELRVELTWCTPFRGDWCCSGGSYCGVSVPTSVALLSAVIKDELQRRKQERYPFFRPVTICKGPQGYEAAFARDISRRGIGLVHSQPIPLGRVLLTVPTLTGECRSIASDIKWCRPVGQDWFLSGAQFAAAWLDATTYAPA